MSHLKQTVNQTGSCPPQDIGEDGAKYQYPPPPGEEHEHTKAYHYPASSNSVILPSMSLQPGGYRPESIVKPQDFYRDAQQSLSDYGRYELGYRTGLQHMSFGHSAPKQRAAIACRYCRRRKIKCSGSGQNAQGRCTNCQNFQQDCFFVPVSGHAQAFVPAHLGYAQMQIMSCDSDVHSLIPGQQLYGAHGQPFSRSYAAVPRAELWGNIADDTTGANCKRRRVDPYPPMLPPPISGQLHHSQNSAKRLAATDNLLRPPTTPATEPVVQQAPSHSPCLSPNLMGSVDIDSRAREIDRNMLGRLDGKKTLIPRAFTQQS